MYPSAMSILTLKVNGRSQQVDVDPSTPLLYVLSDDLELRGPKFGCGLGQCGACTVIVNGQATRSCVTPVSTVGSNEITTLEGLGTAEKPHPLQQAFIDEQAAQCGFCLSGVILTAKTFLDRNPRATDEQIQQALSGVLCRCFAQRAHVQCDSALRRREDGMTMRLSSDARQALARAGVSRRAFLKGSGALVVAFSSAGMMDGLSQVFTQGFNGTGSPQLDSWIAIGRDGIVTAYTGKCDFGQGLYTAQMQLVAEEVGVPLSRVRLVQCDTSMTPDQGTTSGQQSHPTNFNHGESGARRRDGPRSAGPPGGRKARHTCCRSRRE